MSTLYKKLPFFLRPSKIINLIDNFISINFYHSGIGVRNKISSDRHLNAALKYHIKSELAEIAKKKGYVELPELDKSLVEILNSQFDQFILNGVDTSMDKSNSQLAIPMPYNKINFELLFDENTINIIKSYFGTEIEVSFVNAIRNFGPDKQETNQNKLEKFSDKWHFDGSDKYILKLFITLKNTTVDHGPLHILDLDSTKKALINGYRNRGNYGFSSEIFEKDSYKLIGNAGKRVLGATNKCLHRAGVPKFNNFRDMLIVCFAPSKSKFDIKAWKNSLKLNNFEKN